MIQQSRKYGSTIWKTNTAIYGHRATSSQAKYLLLATKNLLYDVASNFIHLIGVICHICGLYLLFKVRKTRSENMVAYTNKTLLLLLSSSEFSAGLFSIVCYISLLMKVQIAAEISALMAWTSDGLSISAIHLITLNRFVSTVYLLWYRRLITKKKFVVVVVLVVWW